MWITLIVKRTYFLIDCHKCCQLSLPSTPPTRAWCPSPTWTWPWCCTATATSPATTTTRTQPTTTRTQATTTSRTPGTTTRRPTTTTTTKPTTQFAVNHHTNTRLPKTTRRTTAASMFVSRHFSIHPTKMRSSPSWFKSCKKNSEDFVLCFHERGSESLHWPPNDMTFENKAKDSAEYQSSLNFQHWDLSRQDIWLKNHTEALTHITRRKHKYYDKIAGRESFHCQFISPSKITKK